MRIVLLGPHGQLGRALAPVLATLGTVTALSRAPEAGPDHVAGSTRLSGNLADLPALERSLRQLRPDLIVNAAAMTNVDAAEHDAEHAQRINADAPACLAREARRSDALLVHYSTDYVFDGRGTTPWQESDPPAPLNVYGASKLAGERAIQAARCRHLILRTSWVYSADVAAAGRNFLTRILELALTRDSLDVVADQTGAPTSVRLLAASTAHLVRALRTSSSAGDPAPPGGLYHLAAAGETTWHDYARLIVRTAREHGCNGRLTPEAIHPIATAARADAARRPANSRLDTSRIRHHFGLSLPDWREDVIAAVAQWCAHHARTHVPTRAQAHGEPGKPA